jgi:N,N'-diacetyllegionaminate synthase
MSVFVIAEAGSNTNGNFHVVKEMICEADRVGADAVKFQALASSVHNSWAPRLKEIADDCEIELMVTPFDHKSVDAWDPYVRRWKIASAELVNLDVLSVVAHTEKPVLLSTGMATEREAFDAEEWLVVSGAGSVTLLQCVSAYPATPEVMNLSWLVPKRYPWGLSDHSLGSHIPIAAVALGAQVIEKHFKLGPEGYRRAGFFADSSKSPDYDFALYPDEFAYMVRCIRDVEKALGDGIKRPMPGEMMETRGRRLESV